MKKLIASLLMALLIFPISNASADIERKAKVSSNDSTAGYLNGKLVAGTGITFTENSDGGNETLTIANSLGSANGAAEFIYIEGATADNFEQILGSVDPTADRTFLLPDDAVAAGDVLVGSAANTVAYVGLANTQILVGDGSGSPAAVSLSGDATMTNAGVIAVADDSHSHTSSTLPATTSYLGSAIDTSEVTDGTLLNADIDASAAIAFSKLASLTSANILVGSAGNVATSVSLSGDATIANTGALTIADNSVDGTDIAFGSDATGDVYYYDGTNVVRLPKGTSGQFLKIGASIPEWATPAGAGDMAQATYDTDANSKVDAVDQIGTLTNLKWCSSNGTIISCTENAPSTGTGTLNSIKENNLAVGDADIVTLDFLGADFDLTESPDTEMNIVIANALTRDAEWDTIAEIETATSVNILVSTELDTLAELETLEGSINIIASTEIDTSSEIAGIVGDETGSGALVFGTAPTIDSAVATTFFKIPTGTGPTVDAAGKIAEDTTHSQIVYGATPNVLDPQETACARVANVTSTDDNFVVWTAPQAVTVTSVGCYCDGTCTTKPTFTLEDNNGNAMTITGTNPTCAATTGSATYAAVTASNGLTAGETMRFDVTNTPSPTTDTDLICWTYTKDRQ